MLDILLYFIFYNQLSSQEPSSRSRIGPCRDPSHETDFAADDLRQAHRQEAHLLLPRRGDSLSNYILTVSHFIEYQRISQILDEVQRILRYIKSTPSLGRAYKVTDELYDLSTMAMEYFKDHVEPRLPEITYFGTEFLDFTTPFSCTFEFLSITTSNQTLKNSVLT